MMKVSTVRRTLLSSLVVAQLAIVSSHAEEPRYDLSKEKVLYCVGYAHLDTQWRWDYCQTIDRYILDTLDQNFDRFEKYPDYVFNFTGSVRYEMMKEYYPERYARLKQYIAAGRWFVSGSSVDEGDANVPSAEALIRQVLYGNDFFRQEFGKESEDYMLPDCFGFPASMPSIWAHCGLKGFSTQKLTWGSAVGIPFKIGMWEGPDGKAVIAAMDPGAYVGAINGRVDTNPEWVERVNNNGEQYGVWADFHYYGVGDMGGAPKDKDVANYVDSLNRKDGKIKVALVSSDQMFKDITKEQRARLPRYKGDLLLTEHSAGTLTSQSYMKRWNRKNEILADAAERVAVMAHSIGGATYPREKINKSWVRVLASQMHDILPGTSIPRAYTFSWNDEIIAFNGFAAVLKDSVGAIVRAMDTRAGGEPIVVYNALAIDREDLAEATVEYAVESPKAVRVFDASGKEVPSQILERKDRSITVLFVARVPSLGLSTFDIRPSQQPFQGDTGLRASAHILENDYYLVTLNDAGDVSSIRDKKNDNRELLAKPAQTVFTHEKPRNWPAWNMDWADRQNPPIDALKAPASVRIAENGPVRVAFEVKRNARNSFFTQRIQLAAGDAGRRVEFVNDTDWQSTECALKASFPLTVANPTATYNWGMGTIDRGNNEPTKYEVPSHEWFDLTDANGEYGVSILEDSKFGSDKPTNNEVRLTLLYTPGVRNDYLDQHSQDWGRHEYVYALYGHPGDWRTAQSEWQGRRLNQPLISFQAKAHDGPLGRSTSILSVNTPQVDVRALKQAEHGDWTIIRLQELWGKAAKNVEITFRDGLVDAHEVDGQERRIGAAFLHSGKLVTELSPYSPRSFAVRQGKPPVSLKPPMSKAVSLDFDISIASPDADRSVGSLDHKGRSIPTEMLPSEIISEGVTFTLGTGADKPQALSCRGQKIDLPAGEYNRLYLLATASEDTLGRFLIDGRPHDVSVQEWTGFVGQYDDRQWDREFDEVDFHGEGEVVGIKTGFIKRDPIAWFCTHRHHPQKGNEAYRFSYLFKYGLDLPTGAKTLTLPENPRIKILAVTVSQNANDAVRPAQPLYDDFTHREPIELRHKYPKQIARVFQGVEPVATITIDRQPRFEDLSMGGPVRTDYADQASGVGVDFRFHSGDGKYSPHHQSGIQGDTLPRLNDGLFAQNEDDTKSCVWYDCEGRFHADLKQSVPLAAINTYSWHRANRAPQLFSLWGSNAEDMPSPDIRQGKHEGWTLLAVAQTTELGNGDIHGSSVKPAEGCAPLGPYRHLLWITEDVGQGTFLTEIDVHVAK